MTRKTKKNVVIKESQDSQKFELLFKPSEAKSNREEFARLLEEYESSKGFQSAIRNRTHEVADPGGQLNSSGSGSTADFEKKIDLHGCTAESSVLLIESFIQTCLNLNLRKVLIVTGKGSHSRSKSVLRQAVEKKLFDLKSRGLVTGWTWESGTLQKSGAVKVYLQKWLMGK